VAGTGQHPAGGDPVGPGAAGVFAADYKQLAIIITQTHGASYYASWNELYITGGTVVLTGTDHYAGVWGHLEVSGAVTTGSGFYSGGHFSVIIPSTMTIASGARLAGCHVDMKLASGYSNSGTVAAFYAEKGADEFATIPYGLYLKEGAFTVGIYSGAKVKIGQHDWGVGADGIEVETTDMLLQVAGKVTTEDAASGVYASVYSQLALIADQDEDVSMMASWNELYVTDADLTGASNFAGCWGHAELAGTVVGSAGFLAAIHGSMIIPTGFTNNGVVACCHVDMILGTGYTESGVTAAFAVGGHTDPNQDKIPYGMYFATGSIACFAFFPDDSVVAAKSGAVGSEAGYILVHIGDTDYKIRTYATS